MRIHDLVVELPGGFRLGPLSVEGPEDRPWLLLGPRGAGKTTLLRAVAERLRARSGAVERTPAGAIALLPQFPERVLAGRNLAEDLSGSPRPGAEGRRRLAAALRDAGLPEARLSRPAAVLSGGERRLAALALLLLSPAPDWAIDEPDAGLDEIGRSRVVQVLRTRLARGGRVWVSTHTPRIYAPLRPFCVLLSGGKLIAAGSMGEVAGTKALRRLAGTSRSPAARFWEALRGALPDLREGEEETLRNYGAPIAQVHEILTDSEGPR